MSQPRVPAATISRRYVLALAAVVALLSSALSGPPAAAVAGLVADEFDGSGLDTSVWSAVDPVGDGSVSVADGVLRLGVPAGSQHDLWNGANEVVRVVQAASDADFEVEAKFDSAVAERFQLQGLIAQQDDGNWVRFDVYHTGSSTNVFAASTVDGSTTVRRNAAIAGGPVWLRMARAGNQWTLSYSHDGQVWDVGAEFSHELTLTGVGPYAGNAGPDPAFEAVVDYFRPVLPDETAPVIGPVDAVGDLASATVSFATDEPATTLLEWGIDDSYGLGSVTGDEPVAEHSLVADGLECGTAYLFRVTATDAEGNAAAETGSVTTADCPPPDETAPVVSGVSVEATTSTVSVSATSDEPATATLSWGPSADQLNDSVTGDALVTAHQVTATGLACATEFAWQLDVADASGNTASESGTITTNPCPDGIASDDFSATTLDTGLWTFVDPKGDSQLTMTGTNAVLHVPKGSKHELWGGSDHAPRLLQPAPDTDFELEMKVDTPVEYKSQGVGLLIERDAQERLAFEFTHGDYPRLYISNTTAGSSSKVTEAQLPDGDAPLYLRVGRVGDTWTASYSADGQSWTEGASFTRALEVRTVGAFASNSNPQASATPAHVASIDYVMNTANRIDPEDGGAPTAQSAPPEVASWYGDDQTFGQKGEPQRWVNILGNVSDADGIASLRYRLNGGDSRGLSMGPGQIRESNARLTAPGDFNVDIAYDELVEGSNTVVVSAIDSRADRTDYTINVNKTSGQTPTLPHDIDWSSGALQDLVQLVDGHWTLTSDGVRTAEPGYDRLLTVGDQTWTDYEVVAPVTFHGFGDSSLNPAAGIIVGWDGHAETFGQPWVGHPFGGLGWYQQVSGGRLQVVGEGGQAFGGNQAYDVTIGSTHMLKLQVEAVSATDSAYRFKAWPAGESEPSDWNIDTVLPSRAGSAALVAHHADVTFGDVSISALATAPLGISNIAVTPSETSASITWTTDAPASSSVAFGPTGAYEDGTVEDATLVTEHSVTLNGLTPGTTYHYAVTSTDADGNTATSADDTFATTSQDGGDGDGPTIEVWYGDTQTVGSPAQPQRWANVLGNVSDADGVQSLSYTLNGGASQPLNIGPDLRRLQMAGDFNVEIDYDDLMVGENVVDLTAEDSAGAITTRTVTLQHQPSTGVLSLPHTVDWTSGSELSQIAQIVDGLWNSSQGGATIAELGYDRTIALGDIQWQDYEVEVPVTVRSLGPDAGTPQSGDPLVGIGLRWQGHSGTAQPRNDFYPVGAYAWHRWQFDGRFELRGNEGAPLDREDRTLELGSTYIFKAQVQTTPSGDEYRFKYWDADEPEPTDWSLSILEDDGLAQGGVLLIAHHVDATFGTVQVSPITP